MAKSFTTIVETRHECLWIVLPETIDMDNYLSIEQRIEPEIQGTPRDLALDFSRTKNLFSSGIGMVVRLKKRVDEIGRKLFLVSIDKKIVEGLENVGLERVFEIFPTEENFIESRGA